MSSLLMKTSMDDHGKWKRTYPALEKDPILHWKRILSCIGKGSYPALEKDPILHWKLFLSFYVVTLEIIPLPSS
jgi:hypothetical protein